MDLRTTLPSHSTSYDEKMKKVRDNLRWSRRLINFLVLTVVLNVILTYRLIFHPPPPSATRCAEFIRANYPDLAVPAAANIARSSHLLLHNDVVAGGDIETTALAVRSTSELAERNLLNDINGRMNIAAIYLWPFVQTMAWWNMVAACQDFTDNASNTVNCLWGVITSVITVAATGVKVAVWYGQVTNTYFNGRRDIHPQLQGSLEELGKIIGHNVTYHGLWDHAQLGLNYSEVAMENEEPLHVFGITSPDGTESHFSYLGNSTGNHMFKMGIGAPGTGNTTTTNSTIHGRTSVTVGNQYFAWGGVDFMIDPNIGDGGYLDYSEPDWDAVLNQVSCIWGSDPTSDNMRAAAHYFQIYDDVDEGTVAAGAMSVFFGSQNSLLGSMSNIPIPISIGACGADYETLLDGTFDL